MTRRAPPRPTTPPQKQTPIYAAAAFGHAEVIAQLADHRRPGEESLPAGDRDKGANLVAGSLPSGVTPIGIAAQEGFADCVRSLGVREVSRDDMSRNDLVS